MRLSITLLLLITSCTASTLKPKEFSSNNEVKITFSTAHINFDKWQRNPNCCAASGKNYAIASGGTNSSKCGETVMSQGGNIVDASVAVAFCLAVERPHSAGLGGGGFLMLHLAREKKDVFIDFRETAPLKASRDMYINQSTGNVVTGASLNGGLAVATPGFTAGLFKVHQKWGKLEWKKILQPAVQLARKGFIVYPSLEEKIEKRKALLVKDDALQKIFVPDKKNGLKKGDLLVQKDLARTIEIVAQNGAKAFYTGGIARDIVHAVQNKNGILQKIDLEKYSVKLRRPIAGGFQDYKVITAPPPSAGGMIMFQVLGVMSQYKYESYSDYLHLLAETMKRGFADRSAVIGDPDYYKDERWKYLISQQHIQKLRQNINPLKTTPSVKIPGGTSKNSESLETTQFSLIDSEGNGISGTITINYLFGACVGVPRRGIILNDEMDDFSMKPGEHNVFGLTSGEANAIAPGKRPVSSMTPTILIDTRGKAVLVTGAPGGSHIISGVTQSVLNYTIVFPMDLKKAVFAPRLHHQWIPDKTMMEMAGFPTPVLNSLKDKGHEVVESTFGSLVTAVSRDPERGQLDAVFDPRDEGGVVAK